MSKSMVSHIFLTYMLYYNSRHAATLQPVGTVEHKNLLQHAGLDMTKHNTQGLTRLTFSVITSLVQTAPANACILTTLDKPTVQMMDVDSFHHCPEANQDRSALWSHC